MVKLYQMIHYLGGAIKTSILKQLKNNEQVIDFLSDTFLFKDISTNELDALLKKKEPLTLTFESGDKIISPNNFDKRIGFVVFGECEVYKLKPDGGKIPLNKLSIGDSFGILGVFSEVQEYPTEIIAKKACGVLFFGKNQILEMIESNHKISLNIIKFMSNRISFLNEKISTFSSDNVEQKFANYILSCSKSIDALSFEINLKKTAEAINSGRASLYRAIDSLSKKSIIKIENKTIFIEDLEGLERIAK